VLLKSAKDPIGYDVDGIPSDTPRTELSQALTPVLDTLAKTDLIIVLLGWVIALRITARAAKPVGAT